MLITKLLVPLFLTAATLAAPSVAHAERTPAGATQTATSASATSLRLAALQDGVRELDTRAKAVHVLMERATPQLRRHSRRILTTVEEGQASIATRLAILQTTKVDVEEETVRSMEATYTEAVKLLSRVESWYQPPRRPAGPSS